MKAATTNRRASTMTSHRHLAAICCGLAAWSCTAVVFAQQRPPTPESGDVDQPTVVVPDAIPWDKFERFERRYKIEAVRFKARDETGIDWWGSDEVMVETSEPLRWVVTNEIGDIDSGDTHQFDPAKSCIIPIPPGVFVRGETSVCKDGGVPSPLGFRVEMWEKDVSLFGFPLKCLRGGPETHAGPHCASDGRGDDFIGR